MSVYMQKYPGTGLSWTIVRFLALALGFSLYITPMVQSTMNVAFAEECTSKPHSIVEEEVHKSIAPAGASLPDIPFSGMACLVDRGHGALPSPLRDVISPPPKVC